MSSLLWCLAILLPLGILGVLALRANTHGME